MHHVKEILVKFSSSDQYVNHNNQWTTLFCVVQEQRKQNPNAAVTVCRGK